MVRKTQILRSWWKTKKEELNQTKSYPRGQEQNTKKKEMAHIKEMKEEREKNDTEYIKKKETINIMREDSCNKEY